MLRAACCQRLGYTGPEDIAKAKEAGFDLHLAKPPTLQEVARALQGDR